MHPSTLLNINISETSGPIATKFYLKHYLGEGKAALCFGPDRIGTLVSLATYSSNRIKMGKISLKSTLARSFLIISSLYLQVTRTSIISRENSNFGQIRSRTAELAALERLKNSHRLITCYHSSSFIFDWIFFILAGNEDNYKSLDEFEFRQNSAADFGVIRP